MRKNSVGAYVHIRYFVFVELPRDAVPTAILDDENRIDFNFLNCPKYGDTPEWYEKTDAEPPQTDPPIDWVRPEFDRNAPFTELNFEATLVYSPHCGAYVREIGESIRQIDTLEELEFVYDIYQDHFLVDDSVQGHPTLSQACSGFDEAWFEENYLLIGEFDTRHHFLEKDGSIRGPIHDFELTGLYLQGGHIWLDVIERIGTITENAYTFWFMTVPKAQFEGAEYTYAFILDHSVSSAPETGPNVPSFPK